MQRLLRNSSVFATLIVAMLAIAAAAAASSIQTVRTTNCVKARSGWMHWDGGCCKCLPRFAHTSLTKQQCCLDCDRFESYIRTSWKHGKSLKPNAHNLNTSDGVAMQNVNESKTKESKRYFELFNRSSSFLRLSIACLRASSLYDSS